mmetsp:Transcript_17802/g.32174  ORF Transcript_17802/g.32174 Transcript_17802/m.32174 type:complete len:362 (+) Transcript_17802:26-1111(+)
MAFKELSPPSTCYTVPSTGASIDASVVVSKLNEIVQQIFRNPLKKIVFDYTEKSLMFMCRVEFPDFLSKYNCESKGYFRSKKDAQKDACLCAIEAFHQGGLLNNNLQLAVKPLNAGPTGAQAEHPHTTFKNYVDRNGLGVCRFIQATEVLNQRLQEYKYNVEVSLDGRIIAKGASQVSKLEASQQACENAMRVLADGHSQEDVRKVELAVQRLTLDERPNPPPTAPEEAKSPSIAKPAFSVEVSEGSSDSSDEESDEDEDSYLTSTGAKVKPTSAPLLVQQFFFHSPIGKPSLIYEERKHPATQKINYNCSLELPGDFSQYNSSSKFMPSRDLAKQYACLEVVKKLDKAGLLNDELQNQAL